LLPFEKSNNKIGFNNIENSRMICIASRFNKQT
jgi:hypothetical protein